MKIPPYLWKKAQNVFAREGDSLRGSIATGFNPLFRHVRHA